MKLNTDEIIFERKVERYNNGLAYDDREEVTLARWMAEMQEENRRLKERLDNLEQ